MRFESGDDGDVVSLDGPLTRNPSSQPTTVGEAEVVEIVIINWRREYLMRRYFFELAPRFILSQWWPRRS